MRPGDATVKPVRRRVHDDQLGVDVLVTIGYRATSDDGWRGPLRETYRGAALDAYRQNHEPVPGSADARERGAEASSARGRSVP